MNVRSCKDCKERYLGCHDKCEKYLKEKKEIIRRNEAMRKDKFWVRAVNR